jgi:hypothetical protein
MFSKFGIRGCAIFRLAKQRDAELLSLRTSEACLESAVGTEHHIQHIEELALGKIIVL